MEKLQGPINPCLISEELEVGNWLDEFISNTTKFEESYNTTTRTTTEVEGGGFCYYGEELPSHYTLPSLEDKMPFLQMLQTVESSQHYQQQTTFPLMQFEPNFQFLLRLQHQKLTCFSTPNEILNHNHIISNITNDGMMKSETDNNIVVEQEMSQKCNYTRSNTNNTNNNISDNDVVKKQALFSSSKHEQEINGNGNGNDNGNGNGNGIGDGVKEKRKRKRTTTRVVKNKEEVETQRMTHIAVERNRRRQMNEHLNALRSLMPPSYAQRGDQASIIGGAIDFVKELEQMLQSLQAQKKMRQYEENVDVSGSTSTTTTTTTTSSSSNMFMDSSFPFHELRNSIPSEEGNGKGNGSILEGSNGVRKSSGNEEYSAEKKSALANIEVVVIQNHVNLKIQCQRRPGQLLKAIVAFEELRLTVLHLNITSLHTLVHYSFNLKIEDDCKLGSADEVARAVHQIFSFINFN